MVDKTHKDIELYLPRNGRLLTEDNEYVNEAEYLQQAIESFSPFNEQNVVQRSIVFSLSSIFPLSEFRDITTGTVTHDVDKYVLAPGSSLETVENGDYRPGFGANAGVGFSKDSDAEADWGYANANSGYLYRYTAANGLQIVTKRGGVEGTPIDRANFNVDPLDGTGPSGIDIDLSNGYIFEIVFIWYGYGPIIFRILSKEVVDGVPPRVYNIHIEPATDGQTSTDNTNLPIYVENTGGSGDAYVTGRQFSIIGPKTNGGRTLGYTRPATSVNDTSWTPLASFRRKLTAEEFYRITLEGFDIINTGNAVAEFQVLLNPTLTNASWVAPENRSSGETVLEFDASADGFSGGEAFYSDIVPSGTRTASGTSQEKFDRNVPRNYIVTIVARTVEDATSTNLVCHIRGTEEW